MIPRVNPGVRYGLWAAMMSVQVHQLQQMHHCGGGVGHEAVHGQE